MLGFWNYRFNQPEKVDSKELGRPSATGAVEVLKAKYLLLYVIESASSAFAARANVCQSYILISMPPTRGNNRAICVLPGGKPGSAGVEAMFGPRQRSGLLKRKISVAALHHLLSPP